MKGIWNKVLRIDLTEGRAEDVSIADEVYEMYGLGSGIASYLLYRETPEKADPLGPDNTIVMAPGLFVGTGVPTGSKTAMTFKSPLTGGFGRSVVGAQLGVSLRRSGYDGLIIQGKSPSLVVVKIDEGDVEFIEGAAYQGRDAIETQELLRDKYGSAYRTCAIGRAGENLSWISDVDFEHRQAARAGGGAVFGAKNLKAILIKGTKDLVFHDPEGLKGLNKKWVGILKDHPATKDDMDYGSGEWFTWHNVERGTCPARNFQWGYFQSVYDNLKEGEKCHLDPYDWVPKYMEKRSSCPNCTKPCGRFIEIKEGQYAGTRVEGIEYETLFSLGSVLEIGEIEPVAKLNEICDREGLDTISAGVTLAWAMEAGERGLLERDKMEGVDLSFGNADGAIEALGKMARRQGYLGELLADGVKRASEKTGKGSERFAIHVKGLEFPAYDVRGIKGLGLAFAVSVRGACHLTAMAQAIELVGRYWKLEGVDRLSSEWKGHEIKTAEDLTTTYDIFGVCKFSRNMFFLEGFPEIWHAVTGLTKRDSDVMVMGERVYTLQKMFNVREGMDRKDDTLPYRATHEPIPKGPSKGAVVTEAELEHMLDEYYMARGWSKNGIPTTMKLASLDLLHVVDEQYGAGI